MNKYSLLSFVVFFHSLAFADCKSWRNDFEVDPSTNRGLGGCDVFVPSLEAGYSSNIGLNIGAALQFPFTQVNGPDGGSLSGFEIGSNIGTKGVEVRTGFRRSAYAMIFSAGYGAGIILSSNWSNERKYGAYAEAHFIGNLRLEILEHNGTAEYKFSIGYRMQVTRQCTSR